MKRQPILEVIRVDLTKTPETIAKQIRKSLPRRRSPLAEYCIRWLLADAVRRTAKSIQLSSHADFDYQLALAPDASTALKVDHAFLESPQRSAYFAALAMDASRKSLRIEIPFRTTEGTSIRAEGKLRLSIAPCREAHRVTVTLSVDYPIQHSKTEERTVWLSLAHGLFPFRNVTKHSLFPVHRALLLSVTQGALLEASVRETDEDGSLLIEEDVPQTDDNRKEQTMFWAHFAGPITQTENHLFTARGVRHLIGLYSLLPDTDMPHSLNVRDLLSALNLQKKRNGIGHGYSPEDIRFGREFLSALSRLAEIKTQQGQVNRTPLQIELLPQDSFRVTRTHSEDTILVSSRLAAMDHVQEKRPLLTTLMVDLGLIAGAETVDWWKETLAQDLDRKHLLSSVIRFEQQLTALVREGLLESWAAEAGPPSEADDPDKTTIAVERQTWRQARPLPSIHKDRLTSEGLRRIIKKTFINTETAAIALNLTKAQLNLAKSRGQSLPLIEQRLRSLGVIE